MKACSHRMVFMQICIIASSRKRIARITSYSLKKILSLCAQVVHKYAIQYI